MTSTIRRFARLLPLLTLGGAIACGEDTPAAPPLPSFAATLVGTEEVPPVNTAATGSATFTLSKGGDTLFVSITVNGLSNVRFGHFHQAARGANGPVVADLVLPPTLTGVQNGRIGRQFLTAANLSGGLAGQPLSALVTLINAGSIYVNLHTDQFPGGELRGQVARR